MTQGNPLSPTLFNMIMDTFICHWVMVVAPTKKGMGVLGLSIQDLVAYFYAHDGLVALTKPERLQREFEVLIGLFDWVVLSPNTKKMVRMACQPCHIPGSMSVEVYERQTTGTGPTFWEK